MFRNPDIHLTESRADVASEIVITAEQVNELSVAFLIADGVTRPRAVGQVRHERKNHCSPHGEPDLPSLK